MKKIFFLLFCFCFAFCDEQIMINIFYSNPKDSQCNLFKDQVASIIDNRYLNTQNILFKTTLINKSNIHSIAKYNIYGDCDLVLSMFQGKEETAFKILSLDSIKNAFVFKHRLLVDTKNVVPNSLLSSIWNFIFQNTKHFYFLNLFFALWCGITSAFLTHQESRSFSPSFSLLGVITSLGIGALLSINFFYTTNKLNFGQVIPLACLAFIILLPFPFISFNHSSLDTPKDFFKKLFSLFFPTILLAYTLFSFKLNFSIALIYGMTFFSCLYLLSISEKLLVLKPFFTKLTSLICLGLSFILASIFGCKNESMISIVLIVCLVLYILFFYYCKKLTTLPR